MSSIEQSLRQVRIYDQDKPYQSVDNISGIRDTNNRIKLMKLPDDFNKQSVLDIGCNTGVFAMEAKRRNAGRVVGIDYSHRSINLAQEIANKHNLNVDFRVCNLNNNFPAVLLGLGNKGFDIVFALSVWKHIYDLNFWTIIRLYCRYVCYFELNAVQDGRYHSESLKQLVKTLKHQPSKMCQYLKKELMQKKLYI